jgi:hypothetical protein
MKQKQALVLVLVALACAAGYLAGRQGRAPGPDQPSPPAQSIDGLVVDGNVLKLGEVQEDREFTCAIPICNETDREINVERFGLGCASCMSVEPASIRIGPGRTETVKLKIDLSQRRLTDFGQPTRTYSGSFWPIIQGATRSNKPGENLWQVTALVKSSITIDMSAVNFGESPVSGQPAAPIKVRVTAHIPLRSLTAQADAAILSVRVRPLDSHLNQFEVLVVPRADLPPGRFQAGLSVEPVAADGQRLPALVLPVAGEVQEEIHPLPVRLLLGTRTIGTEAEEVVVLQAPAGARLEVTGIQTDSSDVHVEPTIVPGSPDGRTFRVVQKVTAIGDRRSTVRFVIRDRSGMTRTALMEVSYRGEAAGAKGSLADGVRGP